MRPREENVPGVYEWAVWESLTVNKALWEAKWSSG